MIASGFLGNGILDANGIIGLAKSGCFPLVAQLFDRAFVSPSVVREVIDDVFDVAIVRHDRHPFRVWASARALPVRQRVVRAPPGTIVVQDLLHPARPRRTAAPAPASGEG